MFQFFLSPNNSYSTSASDSVSAGEAVSRVIVFAATTSDSVSISETVSTVIVFAASASDSVSVGESTSVLKTCLASTSDSISVAESAAAMIAYIVTVSDSTTVSEDTTITFSFSVSTTDNVGVADSFSGFDFTIGMFVVDTASIADALTETLTWTIEDGSGTPLVNVKVWLSFGSPYTVQNLVRDSIKHTNSSGQVNYYIEWNTTYYGWRQLDGYGFTDPWVFRYNTSMSRWESYSNGTWSQWNP